MSDLEERVREAEGILADLLAAFERTQRLRRVTETIPGVGPFSYLSPAGSMISAEIAERAAQWLGRPVPHDVTTTHPTEGE